MQSNTMLNLLLLVGIVASCMARVVIHVSETGNDANQGSSHAIAPTL